MDSSRFFFILFKTRGFIFMGKGSTGVKLLNLGGEWRRLYLTGMPIPQIAQKTGKNMQDIRRAIWLAKIPCDLKALMRSHPETFTQGILMNTFAAKRRQCEQEGFRLLRGEVERLISQGAGTQPNLQKTNKLRTGAKKKAPAIVSELSYSDKQEDPSQQMAYRIKAALGYRCTVEFDKTEGVTISFKDKEEIDSLIIAIEPHQGLF